MTDNARMTAAQPPTFRATGERHQGDAIDLHSAVVNRLGEDIVRGHLKPGAVFSSEQLEARYGSSRSVMREAIRVLEQLGMAASRRRVGVTIAPRHSWKVFDPLVIRWRLGSAERDEQLRSLSELRRGFEPVAAELAAHRATPDHCAALTGAVMEMVRHGKAGDLRAYLAADVIFHSTLMQASGNEMIAALDGVVAEVLRGRTEHDLMPARPRTEAIRLHADVATAVVSGDPVAARAAMEAIIEEASDAIARQLEVGSTLTGDATPTRQPPKPGIPKQSGPTEYVIRRGIANGSPNAQE